MRQSTMQCPFVLFTIRVSWRKLVKRSAVLIIALFSVESTICGTCSMCCLMVCRNDIPVELFKLRMGMKITV